MIDRISKLSLILLIVLILGLGQSVIYAAPATITTRGLVFDSGVSSDQIRLIKDFFRARGHRNVPWGYSYDSRTKELVRSYQREKGIPTTGAVASMTIAQMNKDIRNNRYAIGPREPETSISGDMIIINKSSNTLHHMKNGKVYRSYPVATGRTNNLTPNRKDRIVFKEINPVWYGFKPGQKPVPGGVSYNPLGKRWMGISLGGGRLYGIHGNSNPRSIGKYASSGCIRMLNPDVERLYREVKLYTPVWIGTEDWLSRNGVRFKTKPGTFPAKPKPKPKPKPVENDLVKVDVNVELDGEKMNLEKDILASKGTTYYPFREIIEKIGGEVKWDPSINAAVAEYGGNKIEFEFNSSRYRVNGETKYLPKGQKTLVKDDSITYIPIRYAMEGLGLTVDWEQANYTILLYNSSKIKSVENIYFESNKDIKNDEVKLELNGEAMEEDESLEAEDNHSLKEEDSEKEKIDKDSNLDSFINRRLETEEPLKGKVTN